MALPVEGTHLVVRFVDDLGVPIGAHRVWIAQAWSGPGWGRSEGFKGAPRYLDDSGVVRIPVQKVWSGRLSLNLHECGLFGHAEDECIELEWDGKAGERVITSPRPGAIRGRVITGAPRLGIDVSLSGATSAWYRAPITEDGQKKIYVAYNGPPPVSRRLPVCDDGTFVLTGITPGEVEITLQRGIATDTRTVMVEPGGITDRLDFELEKGGGWIVGRALARDGTPLVGASVSVERATGLGSMLLSVDPSAYLHADVDDQGRFRVGAVREGLYRIELWAPVEEQTVGSFIIKSVQSSQLVWCPASGDIMVDLVAREPSARLEVAVPCSGIDVDVEDDAHRALGWSLALHASEPLTSYRPAHDSGVAAEPPFHFDGLAPGTYTLIGSIRNEPRAVQRVTVRPGERSRVTLAPTAFASLELSVAIMGSIESGDTTIDIRQDDSPLTWEPARIPPGPVHVLVRAEGRAAMHHLELAPNETRTLEPDWKPVSGVEVQVTFQGHETSGLVELEHAFGFLLSDENLGPWFNDTGEPAVFSNVPPGRYRVLLEKRHVRTIDVKTGETTRVRVERR